MKKFQCLFTIIIFFISRIAIAQITINNSDMPTGGSTYIMSTADISSITLSQLQTTGPNQVWDFNLTSTGQRIDTAFSMSQVPFGYQLEFLSSDYADNLSQGINLGTISISDIYTFYNNTSSKLESTGIGATISGLPVPIYNSPTDVIYKFPCNFGNVDSSFSNFSANIPGVGTWIQHRKRTNYVDGWGTLATPYGIKNVLRVHSDIIDNDTISITTPFSFTLPFPRHTHEYKWLAKNSGLPMLQVNTNEIFSNQNISQIIFRDTLNTTGVKNQLVTDDIKIFPQPASNNIFILNPFSGKQCYVNVFNIEGTRLLHQDFNADLINISTTNLPSGIYLLQLSNSNKFYYSKFAVTH